MKHISYFKNKDKMFLHRNVFKFFFNYNQIIDLKSKFAFAILSRLHSFVLEVNNNFIIKQILNLLENPQTA